MRKVLGFACVVVALCGFVACGSVSGDDDAGMNNNNNNDGDGGVTPDANTNPPDAGPPPKAGQELVPTGGRVTGGGFTMDVQLGHWYSQKKATGGGNTVEGAAAVKE